MTWQEQVLPRTGNTPLRFMGEQIAHATSRKDGRPKEDGTPRQAKQYYEATIFRTNGGRFVVAAWYRTDWANEREYRWAAAVDSKDEAVKWLQDLEVLEVVSGYPNVPRFEALQERLMTSLEDQWDWLVGELLAQCAAEFGEVVA